MLVLLIVGPKCALAHNVVCVSVCLSVKHRVNAETVEPIEILFGG